MLLFAAGLITSDYNVLKIFPILEGVRDWIHGERTEEDPTAGYLDYINKHVAARKYIEKYPRTVDRQVPIYSWERGHFRTELDPADPFAEGMEFWLVTKVSYPEPDGGTLPHPLSIGKVKLEQIEYISEGHNTKKIGVCYISEWMSRKSARDPHLERKFMEVAPALWKKGERDGGNSIEPYLELRKEDPIEKLTVQEWEQLYSWVEDVGVGFE